MTEAKRGRPRKISPARVTRGQEAYRARGAAKPTARQPRRIGRDTDVELSRAEIYQLASTVGDLIARWPTGYALPEGLTDFPKFMRRKVIRRGGTASTSVRLPKKTAYLVGMLLCSGVQHGLVLNLDRAGWVWLTRGAMKLLCAGVSRPGKRETSKKEIDPTTAWRRQKKRKGSAAALLLGISE